MGEVRQKGRPCVALGVQHDSRCWVWAHGALKAIDNGFGCTRCGTLQQSVHRFIPTLGVEIGMGATTVGWGCVQCFCIAAYLHLTIHTTMADQHHVTPGRSLLYLILTTYLPATDCR